MNRLADKELAYRPHTLFDYRPVAGLMRDLYYGLNLTHPDDEDDDSDDDPRQGWE